MWRGTCGGADGARAGIVAGHWTALAARQASVVVAHLTPQEGERVFRELGQMRPSKSSLDRLPKALGGQWEGQREAFEATLRASSEVAQEAVTVAVSLDGVMVPMKDAKRADGSAGYQEAGCGTLTYYDAEGERLDTVYFGPDAAAAQRGVEEDARRGARSGARQAPGPARSDDCRRGARQLELSRYVGGAGDGNSGLLPRSRATEVGA